MSLQIGSVNHRSLISYHFCQVNPWYCTLNPYFCLVKPWSLILHYYMLTPTLSNQIPDMFFPVSVTTPKMQRGDRDDARAMTVSAGVSGGAGPPSVPHRAPPALPPRTQRRRVEVRQAVAERVTTCMVCFCPVRDLTYQSYIYQSYNKLT